MAYRTEAHDTDLSRKGAELGAHRAEPESTVVRERPAGSGANREQHAPFSPYEREMRQVLAEMSLLQYGKTQAFNASGGKSENPDPRPSGEAWPLADKWAERWADDPTSATLADARAELQSWKVRTAPVTDVWNERDAILNEGQGFAADVVARRFQRTVTYVRKLRLKDDRESEYGLPIDSQPTRAETKAQDRQRVENLASRGCTLRQIKMQTGVPTETVRRWLREAA